MLDIFSKFLKGCQTFCACYEVTVLRGFLLPSPIELEKQGKDSSSRTRRKRSKHGADTD